MDVISYEIELNGRPAKFEVSQPYMGGDGYDIHINRFYQGVVCIRNGGWVGYFSPKSWMTMDEVVIIGDMIEALQKAI